MKSSLSKLTRWLVFTVFIALVPLLVAVLRILIHSPQPFTLQGVTEHGELLLISTAIGGAALGELIGSGTKRRPVPKIICGGATLILIMTSGMWFADIASASGTINTDVVSFGSLAILLFTVLSSGGCIALSEV